MKKWIKKMIEKCVGWCIDERYAKLSHGETQWAHNQAAQAEHFRAWAGDTFARQSYNLDITRLEIFRQLNDYSRFVEAGRYDEEIFRNPQNRIRVVQLVQSLNYGDAIGNCVLHYQDVLGERFLTDIFTAFMDKRIDPLRSKPVTTLPSLGADEVIIYHYGGHCPAEDILRGSRAKKVLYYHNITPPEFYSGFDSDMVIIQEKGLVQLRELLDEFDYGIADSHFNRQNLIDMGATFPIEVVPLSYFKNNTSPRQSVIDRYGGEGTNLLFVGRMVPNKKIEDVIAVFFAYKKEYDPASRLFLVGGLREDAYGRYLQNLVKELSLEDSVVFTGHVSDEELSSYYQIATVFLCMSEHEGFCMPLVEAMAHDIPVVAYKGTAVTETLGGGGLLLAEKEPGAVAGALHGVMGNGPQRQEAVHRQRVQLERYSAQATGRQFNEAVDRILQRRGQKSDDS